MRHLTDELAGYPLKIWGFGMKFYGLDAIPDASEQKYTPLFAFAASTFRYNS